MKSGVEGAGLVGQGYRVYMDNFFTSPALFVDMFHNFNTVACGTVHKNRKGLPKDIMIKKTTGINERGQSLFRQKGKIAATVWKDKHIVSAISTVHDNKMTEVNTLTQNDGLLLRQRKPCPQIVSDYTKYMGVVDRCDQYIQYLCI